MPDPDPAKRLLKRSRGSKDAAVAITPAQQLQQETLQSSTRRASSGKSRNPEPATAPAAQDANNDIKTPEAAPKATTKRKAGALEAPPAPTPPTKEASAQQQQQQQQQQGPSPKKRNKKTPQQKPKPKPKPQAPIHTKGPPRLGRKTEQQVRAAVLAKRKDRKRKRLLDGNGPVSTFSAPPPKPDSGSGSDAHIANRSTKSLTYTVQPSLPTADEYVALRVGSGLSKPPVEADVGDALGASVYCLVARLPAPKPAKAAKSAKPEKETENDTANADVDAGAEDDASAAQTAPGAPPPPPSQGKAIGMVRLIGDGVIMCQLCDMCVLPEFQGRGIGKVLMDQMLAWVDERAPMAYVSLIGDPGPGQALYRSRGFVKTAGIGMKRSKWGR